VRGGWIGSLTAARPTRPAPPSQLVAPSQPNVGGDWRPFGTRFWLSLVAGSAATGFAAGALMVLLRAVQHFAWNKGAEDFLDAVRHDGAARRVAVLLLGGALVIASRWLLRFSTKGTGSELTAAVWFRAGNFPFARTVNDIVTSIVVVGLGAALGREAAPKQAGALLLDRLARWSGLPATQRRLLVACGAGAGIAAVYNVPFAGALFALEVLLGALSFSLVPAAFAATMIATACAWTLLPNAPTYEVPTYAISPQLVLWAAIAGPAIGVSAAFYVRLICWAGALKPQGWRKFAAPLIVFGALGVASIGFPQLLGNGKDVVQLAYAGAVPLSLALCLIALRPIATAACLGSGAPGGLFTPTLTIGALIGIGSGHAWLKLWPGAAHEVGAYALIGSGAFLAASTQGPVSAVVFVLELTRRVDPTMTALMLTIAGAIFTARRFEARSVYSGRIFAARASVAEDPQPSVSVAARLPELLLKMAARPNSAFAVIDQNGEWLGVIARELLNRHIDDLRPSQIATAGDLLELAQREPSA